MFLGKVGPVQSLGRCFHDWPPAAADDLCRVAFQARVTHFRAAWIVATELGPDPQAARARWRMRHFVLCLPSCGSAGGLEIF